MPAAPRLPLAVAALVASLAVPATAAAKSHDSQRLPAAWQHRFHVRSASADPDGDGLTNLTEFRAHTNPNRADTNHDGTPDGAEDADRDGLDNATEQLARTDPGRRDSDGDGQPDGREDSDRDGLDNLAEQQTGNDPQNPDTDGDGIRDGRENAGRVVSFDGDTLTIRLAATGRLVQGTVDADTDVQCGAADDGSSADGSSDTGTADDTSADDSSSPDDPATADDAATAGDPSADDSTDPSSDPTDASGGGCSTDSLQPGAWVTEAELSDDAGDVLFDTVVLVDGAAQ